MIIPTVAGTPASFNDTKTLKKPGTEVNNFEIVKVMDERPIANIVLSGEKLKAFL